MFYILMNSVFYMLLFNTFQVLEKIQRIAAVIDKLQQFGYVRINREGREYPCNVFKANQKGLQTEAKQLEDILVHWVEYVWTCRRQYGVLNLYTTKQLIILRQELAQVKQQMQTGSELTSVQLLSQKVLDLLGSVLGKPFESRYFLEKELKKALSGESPVMEQPSDVQTESLAIQSKEEKESALSVFEKSIDGPNSAVVMPPGDDDCCETDADRSPIYCRLRDFFGYSHSLSLLAAKRFDDESEAMMWCEEQVLEADEDDQKDEFTQVNVPCDIIDSSADTSVLQVGSVSPGEQGQESQMTITYEDSIKNAFLPTFKAPAISGAKR